jgi:hypothetical protein
MSKAGAWIWGLSCAAACIAWFANAHDVANGFVLIAVCWAWAPCAYERDRDDVTERPKWRFRAR